MQRTQTILIQKIPSLLLLVDAVVLASKQPIDPLARHVAEGMARHIGIDAETLARKMSEDEEA